MKRTATQYAQALHEACQEVGEIGVDTVVANLLRVLEEDGAVELYPQIITAFEQLAATPERGGPEAEFGRSQQLTAAEAAALNAVAASRIPLREKVTDELVGGVVIRVDDTVVDASIAGTLARMRDRLGED